MVSATLKKKRILFRADGSLAAGYGHVIRLLSLASILKKKYNCTFLIQQPDAFLKKQILEKCDELIELPASANFNKEAALLSQKYVKPDDLVVLDGYHFHTAYQDRLKKKCFKLVYIDDLHTGYYVADVIINHSEGLKKEDYSTAFYSKLYLGTAFCILRPSFLKKNKTVAVLPERQRVFISMGGTDQQNYTGKALLHCLKNVDASVIDIVTGSFYPFVEDIKKIAAQHPDKEIRLHSNLSEKEMSIRMRRSTVGICSASTVSYEYASVGGALFVYQTADNQKNIYSFLIHSTVAFNARLLGSKLEELKKNGNYRQYLKNRDRYFTGQSVKNLQGVFEKLELERDLIIRKAEPRDLMIYYKWANEKEVRANSVNQGSIALSGHSKWFLSKLKSKNAALFIFEKKGVPLGQVRLEAEDDHAEIGYSIAPKFRGKGYGEVILYKALEHYWKKHPQKKIIAKVKENNQASNRVFIKMGFSIQKPVTIDHIVYKRYHLLPSHEYTGNR